MMSVKRFFIFVSDSENCKQGSLIDEIANSSEFEQSEKKNLIRANSGIDVNSIEKTSNEVSGEILRSFAMHSIELYLIN